MRRLVMILLIGGGVLLRFLPHPWGVTPLSAIALFSGAHLNPRKGLVIVLAILFLSDFVIGFHSTMPFTWGAVLLVMVLGRCVRRQGVTPRLFLMSFWGSVIFYLVSNLGVFLVTPLYPKTAEGLLTCFAMALPFFRNALLGDGAYAFLLFGAYSLALKKAAALRADPANV